MQGTVGGSLASAHIGINMGTNYNASNGTFNINFQENIGLGIGEKELLVLVFLYLLLENKYRLK